jgi:hypothetical protein
MRWVAFLALLLFSTVPAAPQDGCDDSGGIEVDSPPSGPEKPEPKKEKKDEPAPKDEGGGRARDEDGFRPPTLKEIDAAIDRGVAWLKKTQHKDGSWGPCVADFVYGRTDGGGPCYQLGPTAFALFALGTCGVSRDDFAVRHGADWIETKSKYGYRWTSYESSAAILALTALNGTKAPPNPKALPRSDGARPPKGTPFRYSDWSMMTTRVLGLLDCLESGGGFDYWADDAGRPDVSATQFAILALRAASFAGYPVEDRKKDVWARNARFLEQCQSPGSGGFPYHRGDAPSSGMTAAGVSTLVICREQMRILKDKPPASIDDAIAKGLLWLDANFDLERNPSPHFEGRSHYHYCHLYAVERTGILAGRHELGGKDWYMRGAAYLLAHQDPDGSWNDVTCMTPKDTLGTCFALLFLKRATPPAVTVSGD